VIWKRSLYPIHSGGFLSDLLTWLELSLGQKVLNETPLEAPHPFGFQSQNASGSIYLKHNKKRI
jgi:hypothetical protein